MINPFVLFTAPRRTYAHRQLFSTLDGYSGHCGGHFRSPQLGHWFGGGQLRFRGLFRYVVADCFGNGRGRVYSLELLAQHVWQLPPAHPVGIAPAPMATRGYVKLYIDHVQQAHLGADLDILQGGSGDIVTRDLH